MEANTYKTITAPCEGSYKEKGSRFLAFSFPVLTEAEAKAKILWVKKEHPKCRHHCYAYRIGTDLQPDGAQGEIYRMNDAGEPSGTAGRPILNQIDSHGLTNIIIIVARYFGGTLLG
ncbi:MAG TPA: YigZ family protein, partial [Flavobacterium sp.]|nr:YigZ family protein [Flavobacterium sp.]